MDEFQTSSSLVWEVSGSSSNASELGLSGSSSDSDVANSVILSVTFTLSDLGKLLSGSLQSSESCRTFCHHRGSVLVAGMITIGFVPEDQS